MGWIGTSDPSHPPTLLFVNSLGHKCRALVMEGLKRSSSAERQSEFNKDLENHRYGDNSYHRRHEMPPPWERGGLYSDRHRMPQRDPEPHQEYTNRPYRQPQREHPTPYGGHVTQQYGHPMERPRYERRRNSLEAEVGFEFDVSGGRMYKERQEFNNSQFDNRAMNRDRIVTMEDVKYLNEYDGQPRLEPNKPRTLEKEDVFLKLIPVSKSHRSIILLYHCYMYHIYCHTCIITYTNVKCTPCPAARRYKRASCSIDCGCLLIYCTKYLPACIRC